VIERIFIKSKSGGQPEERQAVRVVTGAGIEGDRYFDHHDEPGQNVTFVEAEVIEEFQSLNGRPVDLSVTGRNVVTRGVRLNELLGKEFCVGEVRLKGVDLCDPCLTLGEALADEHITPAAVVKQFVKRGGLRADVLSSGELCVGAKLESAA
jgi:MOSC domain-containing protein YiiM